MGKCYLLVMSSRMDNSVRIRIYTDSQQAEDVLELGLNESIDGEGMLCLCVQVIGRRRVRGQTSMPNNYAKYDGDRISVSFIENGKPVDKKTTSKLSHFIRSLVRSGKYYPLHKPWLKVDIAKKQTLLDILNIR
ncbi:hypothetical protein Tco_0805073 [Tanacetum coccineum]